MIYRNEQKRNPVEHLTYDILHFSERNIWTLLFKKRIPAGDILRHRILSETVPHGKNNDRKIIPDPVSVLYCS